MTKLVAPAPGRTVRRPEQGYTPLPQEGAPVEWNPYWERALMDGDIVVVGAKKPSKPEGES